MNHSQQTKPTTAIALDSMGNSDARQPGKKHPSARWMACFQCYIVARANGKTSDEARRKGPTWRALQRRLWRADLLSQEKVALLNQYNFNFESVHQQSSLEELPDTMHTALETLYPKAKTLDERIALFFSAKRAR